MNNYTIQIPKQQLNIINCHIFNDNKRAKCLSVLAYIIKNLDTDNSIRMSLDRLHARYSAWKGRKIKIGRTHFINLVNELAELKLLTIQKVGRLNKYFFNPIVDEKVIEKVDKENLVQSIENSKIEVCEISDKEEITNSNLNTNTNIGDIIKTYGKSFRMLKGDKSVSKSDLRAIAKNLFSLRNIHETVVQSLVFAKINHSHQTINSYGAVAYINSIITEKLIQTTEEYGSVTTFNGYDLADLEKKLI